MPEIIGLPYEKRPQLKLVGIDGNAFAIMGAVREALRRAGLREAMEQYTKEAQSGDYDHLFRVSMSYVRPPDEEEEDDDDYDDDDDDDDYDDDEDYEDDD